MPIPVSIPGGALTTTDDDVARAELLLAKFAQLMKSGSSGATPLTPALIIPSGVNPPESGGVPQTEAFALDTAEEQLMYRHLFLAIAQLFPLLPTPSLIWGSSSIGTTTTTVYLAPGYSETAASASPIAYRLPRAGVLKNLRAYSNGAGVGASTITVSVRKNGTFTPLACAYAATSQDGSDLSTTVDVAAGDLIDIAVTKSAGLSSSPTNVLVSVEYSV